MLPKFFYVNLFSGRNGTFSSNFIWFVSNQLQAQDGESIVDNTRDAKNVLLQFEDHAAIRREP